MAAIVYAVTNIFTFASSLSSSPSSEPQNLLQGVIKETKSSGAGSSEKDRLKSSVDAFHDAFGSSDKTKTSESIEAAMMQEVKEVADSVDARGGEKGGKDKLELLETIGGGAHGTVFKGRWRNMDVAVKTVLFPFEHGSSSAAAKQRAILEAGVSCSASHPNVVATYHYDIKAVQAVFSPLPLPLTDAERAAPGYEHSYYLS